MEKIIGVVLACCLIVGCGFGGGSDKAKNPPCGVIGHEDVYKLEKA